MLCFLRHASAPHTKEDESERTIWPLALHFWGRVWTLAAWCELRQDFRTFRVDRAEGVFVTGERFEPTAGRRLEDYLARVTRIS